MKVFKTFFKILNKYKLMFIMYVAIFTALMLIYTKQGKDNQKEYEDIHCKVAIFDQDESAFSENLKQYLEKSHTLVALSEEERVLLDSFYHQEIDVALWIRDGFEEGAKEGNFRDYLTLTSISQSNKMPLFETALVKYLSTLEMYLKNGISGEQAFERTEKAMQQEVSVSFQGKQTQQGVDYFYFVYIAYVMMAGLIASICPVLLVFRRKNIRKRILCSSYTFADYHKELLMAVILAGFLFCMAFLVLAGVLIPKEFFSQKGILYILNVFCYCSIALTLTFILSNVLKSQNAVSMASNVISLGMSFLCGIFVPKEFLSEQVLAIARFLPAYWYSENVAAIHNGAGMKSIAMNMGIQLLFAAAFVVIGLVVSKEAAENKAAA